MFSILNASIICKLDFTILSFLPNFHYNAASDSQSKIVLILKKTTQKLMGFDFYQARQTHQNLQYIYRFYCS